MEDDVDELEFNTLVQRFIDIAEPYVIAPAVVYNWAVRQAVDFQQYARKDGRQTEMRIRTTGPLGRAPMPALPPAKPKAAHKRRAPKRERLYVLRREQ
jgi:hypothetical protein